ncbi:hypothetical protein LBO01_18210 [Companilactobacillus paralimentarius]|nr:hypothetical protein LBO01_18210 [Companilactobacillus paralimentarius]
MKMIKTSCGYMTPVEAKIIGHIDKEERKKKKHINKKKIIRK